MKYLRTMGAAVLTLFSCCYAVAQDVNEPNNDILSATTLTCGSVTTAYIQTIGDKDWYEFQLSSNGTISAMITNAPNNLDLNLAWYELNGTTPELIAMDDDLNAGGGQMVTATAVVPAGTYYLMIEEEDNNTVNTNFSYSFEVTCLSSPFELNQTIDEAAIIPADTCIEDRIWGNNQDYWNSTTGADDQDWYEVTLLESGNLKGELIVPASIDMHLALYRDAVPLPELITDDGDISASPGQDLSLVAYVEAGTYYFHLEDEENNTTSEETYIFCTEFIPSEFEVNQTLATASSIPSDTCFQERIFGENQDYFTSTDGADDQDWYEFVVTDSCALLVQITNVPATLDLNAEIIKENGILEELVADDGDLNSTGGQALEIQAILPPGTFYLHIEDEDHNDLSEELFTICISCEPINTANTLNELSQTIIIAPNPVMDNLSISGVEQGSYTILDPTGRMIKSGGIEPTISVSELNEGLYTIFVRSDSKTLSARFVKR